jgi:hypothetical protein
VLKALRDMIERAEVDNDKFRKASLRFNTLAAAVIAAGLFGPVAALVYQLVPVTIGTGYIIAVAFGCLALGGVLHLLGLVFLRRLRA